MQVNQTFIKVGICDPKLAYQNLRGENSYLLESIVGSMKKARYSFIGFNPVAKVTVGDGLDFEVFDPEFEATPSSDDPFKAVESLMSQYSLCGISLSRFCGGFVGYMAYDAQTESTESSATVDDLGHPRCEFLLTRNNIIFDHKSSEAYIVENHFCDAKDVDAESSIRDLEKISARMVEHRDFSKKSFAKGIESNFTEHDFKKAVGICKNYIRDGDAFQVVLSQRLTKDFEGDPFDVYNRLLELNPSPYMYYLDFGKRVVAGSSPETLVRVESKTVSTYPIAGTRKRGADQKDDMRLEEELLNDEKELAEHLMLLDLGRNDIGKVSEYGTVNVTGFMNIERYSHVMHISSEVQGRLAEPFNGFDALKAVFPAGTVSGAPKVRAMQIIDELEPTKRGIYAGCVGYFSFNGSMDTAIAIRTIVFQDGKAHVQAGAGIVADSSPTLEYEETMNKAGALIDALEGKG